MALSVFRYASKRESFPDFSIDILEAIPAPGIKKSGDSSAVVTREKTHVRRHTIETDNKVTAIYV